MHASSTSPARAVFSWRFASIAVAVGIAVHLLMHVGSPTPFRWQRIFAASLTGFCIYLCAHLLDQLISVRIRRRREVSATLVRIVVSLVYFAGGCFGVILATSISNLLGLTAETLTGPEMRWSLGVAGSLTIVVGLLFYTYEVMRRQLRESITRATQAEFAEKELELARSIQERLLPPRSIEGVGYRITARNTAARFVAGDFYDVFPPTRETLALVAADVSGKGVGASLIMASVKAILPLQVADRTVELALAELNEKLLRELGHREFVALALLKFDPRNGEFSLANAGLPDPYLLRPGGQPEALVVGGTRLPLGAKGGLVYSSLTGRLERGERIVLLTDGLVEAPVAPDQPLGYAAFEEILGAWAATSGSTLNDLFRTVSDRTLAPAEDDWTAVVLERC